MAQILCDDLAGSAKNLEDVLFALAGKHNDYYRTAAKTYARSCTILHDHARFCYAEAMEAVVNRPGPLMILIAGPYRSGTNDDPRLMARNLDQLESFALRIYNAGHIPMIGEWVALPLMKQAGCTRLGDAISEQYLYPVANRLIERCDAVLRIGGPSKGADEDVRLARERGLPVYFRIDDVPVLTAAQEPIQ